MKKINDDFQNFQMTKSAVPPKQLSEKILAHINVKLNPSHKKVFLKLCTIHGLVGLLTLLFCPQFQLSLVHNTEIFHYFHYHFGANICMAICGGIFLGSGAIFATYILSPVEISKIRKSKFLYNFALSSLAISIFILFGAELYFSVTIFWFIGAIGSSIILMEINSAIRSRVLH